MDVCLRALNLLAWLMLTLLITSCGGSEGDVSSTTGACDSQLTSSLQQLETNEDFTLLLSDRHGSLFQFSRGASSPQVSYKSASTSKLITAVVILRLVDQGYLSLGDRPQNHILNWPIGAGDTLFDMSLEQLLSFTSGLTVEPLCINNPLANFENCVQEIALSNRGNGAIPGDEFYYASTHMQVAGLMAIRARNVTSWQDIFEEFKAQTGLFLTSKFDLPSFSNPRLAGGMHWTAQEYLDFLKALADGTLLGESSMAALLADHTALSIISKSPAIDTLGEEWHYGLGLWHECASVDFDCDSSQTRVSSPGSYGAYPFWDRDSGLVGIFARQGSLGTGFEGVLLMRAVQNHIEDWLLCQNGYNQPLLQ